MRSLLLVATLILLPPEVMAITADELQRKLEESNQYHLKRSRELKSTDANKILEGIESREYNNDANNSGNADKSKPPAPVGEPPRPVDEPPAPVGKPPQPVDKPPAPAPVGKPTRQVDDNVPPSADSKPSSSRSNPGKTGGNRAASPCAGMPPSWCGTQVSLPVQDQQVSGERKVNFGIKRGVTFSGVLERLATNADAGDIEITVTETIQGSVKDLESGSVLFCDKRFNSGTRRLDVTCNSGITPSGEEFSNVRLYVRDMQLRSGLAGVVTADKRIVERAGVAAGTTFVKAAAGLVGADGIGGKALAAGADSLADQSSAVAKEKVGRLKNIITVSPTQLKIFVGGTF